MGTESMKNKRFLTAEQRLLPSSAAGVQLDPAGWRVAFAAARPPSLVFARIVGCELLFAQALAKLAVVMSNKSKPFFS